MDNSVRIGDLGVATVLNPNDGFLVKKVGTPYYLSPEVCEDKPYNHKWDIWSLGWILYEIWALKHPFEASTQAELMVKIIKGKYKRIPKMFSKHLSNMIHWLLTKSSHKRPSIEEIILHPLFQKKSVQLRIPLPIRPKEIIQPGDALKVTGGCFDISEFTIAQSLTTDAKGDVNKRKGKHFEFIKNNPKNKPSNEDNTKSRDHKSKINKSVSSEINIKLSDDKTPEKIKKEMSVEQLLFFDEVRANIKSSINAQILEWNDESKEGSLEELKNYSENNDTKNSDVLTKTDVHSEIVESDAVKSNYYKKNTKDPHNLKKWAGFISPDDPFSSHFIKKEKNEIRKMALEKRKKYGQMIQKQVLKMHKKK